MSPMRLTSSFQFLLIISAILCLPSQVLSEPRVQLLAQYLEENEPQDSNKTLTGYKDHELYKLTASKSDPGSQVFFDGFKVKTHKPYEAGGSESRFAAVTAKWSNRFVSLQPYTYGCFLGCYNFDYPQSSSRSKSHHKLE